MDHHLGSGYARVWADTQVLRGLAGRTVREALDAGEDPKVVWRVVHATLVFLHVEFQRVPRVAESDRVLHEVLADGVFVVTARYGFMETPDIPRVLQQCTLRGLRVFPTDCTFFLGQHVVVPLSQRRVHHWQRTLFAWLQRRSAGAAKFFGMPPRQVVILSTVVEL